MTRFMESQIETRERLDDAALESAYADLAASVSTMREAASFVFAADDAELVDSAARACLRYVGARPGYVPDGITDVDERIDWLCRPSGTMRRSSSAASKFHVLTYCSATPSAAASFGE